ncbi:cytochrome c biogenesis protein [Haliangium ochraceum]|uniref:Heme exporter protein C n=1 Tax=Haliangium ochraceum (strain DSM 14365 / JCM 11303 / SMP-2) TaxID=502025 RepID=D0LV22_HALO1|nr:cytochrome c biogenesis protein CcsA [Haliangium ochraceum]ACY15863.1 cytochrome c assembly protein [Haliangium ochraceum DSM 14365]
MKRTIIFVLAALCALGFFYTIDGIFYGTPLDRQLYFNQKIFYYHVPCSFALFAAVITCGVSSIFFLAKRQGRYDDIAEAAGELAVLFGTAMMASGMIWGRAAWNVWWSWDPRLTTALLLWMTMISYLLVRKYAGPSGQSIAAGVAIFGMANVPLVYYSVKIWRTLHPETSVVPSLDPAMRGVFWASVFLFLAFFTVLVVARVGQTRAARQLREARERGLDAGLLE